MPEVGVEKAGHTESSWWQWLNNASAIGWKLQALLDEVELWWKSVEAPTSDAAVTIPVIDWLFFHVLRREAEALIRREPVFRPIHSPASLVEDLQDMHSRIACRLGFTSALGSVFVGRRSLAPVVSGVQLHRGYERGERGDAPSRGGARREQAH